MKTRQERRGGKRAETDNGRMTTTTARGGGRVKRDNDNGARRRKSEGGQVRDDARERVRQNVTAFFFF